MAGNVMGKRMSVSFTLPISCQICLGKVKQPTVCPNHHVFCHVCIELWLQHNQQCPTCRIAITPENPCKQILGGHTQEDGRSCDLSNPALRRARFDMLYLDYENEITRLKEESDTLQTSNQQLQDRLKAAEQSIVAIKSYQCTRTVDASTPGQGPDVQLGVTFSSGIPSKGTSHKLRVDESSDVLKSGSSAVDSSDDNVNNSEMLRSVRSKLKQATLTYDKIKQDMDKLKETNAKLSTDNRDLVLENGRLKQVLASHSSPRKYEKYASMAQQSKLDKYKSEVSRLKSALERSDGYIEELEKRLGRNIESYSKQVSECTLENTSTISTPTLVKDGLPPKSKQFVLLERFGGVKNTNIPCFNSSRSKYEDSIESSDASDLTVTTGIEIDTRQPKKLLNEDFASENSLNLEQPCTGRTKNTPSTSMAMLSLESADDETKKVAISSLLRSSSSYYDNVKMSKSCDRQLDFGPSRSKEVTFPAPNQHGAITDDSTEDDGSFHHNNETFSDLNFTVTSELSDCAELMKDAERRIQNKKDVQIVAATINTDTNLQQEPCSFGKPPLTDNERYPLASEPISSRYNNKFVTKGAECSKEEGSKAIAHVSWSTRQENSTETSVSPKPGHDDTSFPIRGYNRWTSCESSVPRGFTNTASSLLYSHGSKGETASNQRVPTRRDHRFDGNLGHCLVGRDKNRPPYGAYDDVSNRLITCSGFTWDKDCKHAADNSEDKAVIKDKIRNAHHRPNICDKPVSELVFNPPIGECNDRVLACSGCENETREFLHGNSSQLNENRKRFNPDAGGTDDHDSPTKTSKY